MTTITLTVKAIADEEPPFDRPVLLFAPGYAASEGSWWPEAECPALDLHGAPLLFVPTHWSEMPALDTIPPQE